MASSDASASVTRRYSLSPLCGSLTRTSALTLFSVGVITSGATQQLFPSFKERLYENHFDGTHSALSLAAWRWIVSAAGGSQSQPRGAISTRCLSSRHT